MGRFKEFQQRKKNTLLWDAPDFLTMRNYYKNFGNWNPDFLLLRKLNHNLHEAVQYDKVIHDSDEIRPLGLTEDHKKSLRDYTSTISQSKDGFASSANMKARLQHRIGNYTPSIIGGHSVKDIDSAIERMDSAFTSENTNKRRITIHGAVKSEFGDALEKSEIGTTHIQPSYTSASTDVGAAYEHSRTYDIGAHTIKHTHIVDYDVPPNVGISVVNHSHHSENEIVLKRGVNMIYKGSIVDKVADNHFLHTHKIQITE